MQRIAHFAYAFAGREAIESNPIRCPACHGTNYRRSRRRVATDYLYGIAGILPWRCETCEARFYARAMPLHSFRYAHCRICGNFDLQRISAERIQGIQAIPWRVLGIPALRCNPCRHKFFSIRPLRGEARAAATAPGK